MSKIALFLIACVMVVAITMYTRANEPVKSPAESFSVNRAHKSDKEGTATIEKSPWRIWTPYRRYA